MLQETWSDTWHPTASFARWIAKDLIGQAFSRRAISAACLPLVILLADGWNHSTDANNDTGGPLTKDGAKKWEWYVGPSDTSTGRPLI